MNYWETQDGQYAMYRLITAIEDLTKEVKLYRETKEKCDGEDETTV